MDQRHREQGVTYSELSVPGEVNTFATAIAGNADEADRHTCQTIRRGKHPPHINALAGCFSWVVAWSVAAVEQRPTCAETGSVGTDLVTRRTARHNSPGRNTAIVNEVEGSVYAAQCSVHEMCPGAARVNNG